MGGALVIPVCVTGAAAVADASGHFNGAPWPGWVALAEPRAALVRGWERATRVARGAAPGQLGALGAAWAIGYFLLAGSGLLVWFVAASLGLLAGLQTDAACAQMRRITAMVREMRNPTAMRAVTSAELTCAALAAVTEVVGLDSGAQMFMHGTALYVPVARAAQYRALVESSRGAADIPYESLPARQE